MKRIISFSLCALMIILSMSAMLTASALDVSINQGMTALREQWEYDEHDGVDYAFYSPVRGDEDITKYPLVIILHGKFSGENPGSQIRTNNFPNWSSAEFQSRFYGTGGAFILMPRSPGGNVSGWGSGSHDSAFFAMLNTFIEKHKENLDVNKISIGGWSVGGEGAVRIAAKQPDIFCALFPMAPYNGISQTQADSLKDVPVWLVLCEKDTMAPYGIVGAPSWDRIKKTSSVPSQCRVTIFEKYDYYEIQNHYVHNAVIADMLNQPSDCGMKTYDGEGNTIDINETSTMITWLSHQSLEEMGTDSCGCDCHSTDFFTRIIWSIKTLFWRIFGTDERFCQCGISHW